MPDTNPPPRKRSLSELISENKRLSEQADQLRQRIDELNSQITKRVGELEKRAETNPPSTPP